MIFGTFLSHLLFYFLRVTGDLFDEGKWCPPAEFESYVARFRSLFRVDTSKTRVHVMAGNHDIGFHYAVNPYLDSRFREAFNTKAVQLSVLENTIPIVRINSMAFEGDSCFLCKEAKKNLEIVKKKLQVFFDIICQILSRVVVEFHSPANIDVTLPTLQNIRRALQ